MRILLLLFITTVSFAQDRYLKEADLKSVLVNPGFSKTFTLKKGIVYVPVYLAIEGVDTTKDVIVKIDVSNVTPPAPIPKIVIPAITATSVGTAVLRSDGVIHEIKAGTTILFPVQTFAKHTKVKITYARGNSGNAPIILRVMEDLEISFPSTGGWSTFEELTLPLGRAVEGKFTPQLISKVLGPANIKSIEFE